MAEQKVADSVSSFRVTYHPFGGRSEPIKLAATLSGISFETKMVSSWAPIKKAGNAVWSGPPEVTLLDKDGNDVSTIAQSNACLRFVGSLSDAFYPSNLLQRARIDSILDSCEDLLTGYGNYAYTPADAKDAAAKKLIETYTYWFAKFEARLEENEKRGATKGFFVGNALSIADLKGLSTFAATSNVPGVADLFEKFARLNAWFNRINANEDIKAAQTIYNANYAAFKADEKQNLFKHSGRTVFVGEPSAKRILMVLTNTATFQKGDATVKTGFYIPEIAHPFAVFAAAGFEMTYVSPLGGAAPCDPSSLAGFKDDAECKKFQADVMGGKDSLATVKIEDVKDAAKYDAIFYVGGVGVMWDFPDDKVAAATATAIYENGGIVGGVCHGPAGLINIKLSNGKSLVEGKTVTGFTNEEEEASGLTATVPLLLETALKAKGAVFTSVQTWGANVEVSERVFTGQNPASASGVAKKIAEALN